MIDLSAIEYIEIDSADFAGRRFAVISNERVDAGDGALNGPIMPIPVTLLNIFGSRASIHLRGVSAYDPVTGQVTTSGSAASIDGGSALGSTVTIDGGSALGGGAVIDGGFAIPPATASLQAFVYPESYTIEERASIPEVKQGDIRVYVPGRSLGYHSVALVILQVRDTGTSDRLVE